MQFKWNEKINQVTENTLVVGMDIAKRVHYACFVDERGRVIEKAFAVHQSKEGFEHLYKKIRQIMKEAKKTEVIVRIEPTGHYKMNLANFLDHYGIPLVMVNPMHVKRSKEAELRIGSDQMSFPVMLIPFVTTRGLNSFMNITQHTNKIPYAESNRWWDSVVNC